MEKADSTSNVDNGFILFHEYKPNECTECCQNCARIEKKLDMMIEQMNKIVESVKIVQADQGKMLFRMANSLIRSGVPFPFVAMGADGSDISCRPSQGQNLQKQQDLQRKTKKENNAN